MGFFDLLTDAPTIRGDEIVTAKKPTRKAILDCDDCKLHEGCRSPKLRFSGEGRKNILIIGEQPSRSEDEAGKYGSGDSYRFLEEVLDDMGISLSKDCYYTTAINCVPGKTRLPTYQEVSACRSRITRLIEKLRPLSIILVGEAAFNSIVDPRLSGRISGMGFNAFVGEHIPDQLYRAWITPVWSIATLKERRNYDDGASSKPRWERDAAFFNMWKRHLKEACEFKGFIEADYRDQCTYTEDVDIAKKYLKDALKWKRVAFDYETTGLKPHREGHEIYTVAISDGYMAVAFPFFDDKEFRALWQELMLSKVEKIGQNIPYEIMWTHALLGYYPKNWEWDTMLGQHCLANQKPNNLKFMVYCTFGSPGYDDEVDEFLKATAAEEERYGSNAINRIKSAPMDKLLTYNALDALYTYKLADRQRLLMSEFQLQGLQFFVEAAQTLTVAQENGFNIDMEAHGKVEQELTRLMEEQHKIIMRNPVLSQWTEGQFNYQSASQLSKLLYEILKVKPTGFTKRGAASVDEEALSKMDVPIVKDILAYRKLFKMRDTYISQYAVESVGGKVHPFFNINRVDTFRSCVAKGSLVLVVGQYAQYPQGVPIELVRSGDFVYTYDEEKHLTIKKVIWAGKTGHREVIRIHYKGGYAHSKEMFLDVTPEHLIRTLDGSYVEAQYLLQDTRDRTDPKWRHLPKSRVLSVARVGDRLFPTNAPEKLEHRFVYECFTGEVLNPDDVIHHKNGNHLDHTPQNLEKTNKEDHGRIHYSDCLGTLESRANNKRATALAHKLGHYHYVSGAENANSINLSRTACLRIFVKQRGVINGGTHDYGTYLKYCAQNGVNVAALKIRYNKKHEYLSRWRVVKAMQSGARSAQVSLGVGRYRLVELCKHYGIDTSLYFRGSKYRVSPWKDVSLNNHQITKIEWLGTSVDVYDLEVEDTHNFIANEICVHNSSNGPNIQNQPKRDKHAKALLRSFIRPSRGNRIVEYDYKSLEVCINACYSNDPMLVKYITDPSSDMHTDSTADCFLLDVKDVTKALRNDVKGQFVFAEFYGSYYAQVAIDLWETAHNHNLIDHLRSKGIKNFQDFEAHIKEAERILWEERFPIHDEWRDKQWKFYQKHGYVELLTGFRAYGPMSRNNTFNTPVQGAGYHVLQWTMNQVNKKVEKLEYSKLIGEIHDSCLGDIHPSEQGLIDHWYWLYGTQKVREHWDWISVPLMVEKEQSEIDGTWAEMSGCGYLKGD